jgi:hypothetical protein
MLVVNRLVAGESFRSALAEEAVRQVRFLFNPVIMSKIPVVEIKCLPKLLLQRGGTNVSFGTKQGANRCTQVAHDEHFQFEPDS